MSRYGAKQVTAILQKIARYPIKSLSAEYLEQAELVPGQGLPNDRRFALAQGSTEFSPSEPKWLPKTAFLTLLRNERLALLDARFDEEDGHLTLFRGGRQVLSVDLMSPTGPLVLGQFIGSFLQEDLRGTPKLITAESHNFADSRESYLSIINLASLEDLGQRILRQDVDERRFRANLIVSGAGPWEERGWVGEKMRLGETLLQVDEQIERCAATDVNPENGLRDLNIPKTLQRAYRQATFGVYAKVLEGGTIKSGDRLELVG